MVSIKKIIILFLLVSISTLFAQENQNKEIKLTGIIIDKKTKEPIEYTMITIMDLKSKKMIAGAITGQKGQFSTEVKPGVYIIKIEYIGYKPITLENKKISKKTDLGKIRIEEEEQMPVELHPEKYIEVGR